MTRSSKSTRLLLALILALGLLSGCGILSTPVGAPTATSAAPGVSPTGPPSAAPVETSQAAGLSADQIATLSSLEKVDDFPLYSMHYYGDYSPFLTSSQESGASSAIPARSQPAWACSLFAALGDPAGMFYGRNFDWQFSPAVLLFSDPPDGFASVSMVDIAYLDDWGSELRTLTDLPLSERQALLYAPYLPFDGMNERGLVVGMAAVPPGNMRPDPQKETVDLLHIIREMLDHAADVDQAAAILGSYNIDFSDGPPLHYLLADASGRAALVEFYRGEMHIIPNQGPWQGATNFLVSSTGEDPGGHCWRYDRLNQHLAESQGRLSLSAAMDLLSQVAQDGTQWSVVYGLQSGEVAVVMGRDYQDVHIFALNEE